MAKGILARKLGMTQLFTERGTVVAVTVLQADSCEVVQRKTELSDGYNALQLGFGDRAVNHSNKPAVGHAKRAGLKPKRKMLELRGEHSLEPGAKVSVEIFSAGERVDVTGTSKGKGFAGTVKRHNFSRGPVSHGSMNTRQPGSIGSVDAARVFKGMKMAGQHGNVRRTTRHLELVRVDAERNLLLVKGAVPGARNSLVLVRDNSREGSL